KRRYVETIFKRLWWHGYQGKVGLFDWPCRTMLSLDLAVNYDRSEYRAWKSAAALGHLLTDLDRTLGNRYAGQVRILAHSQGNVVVGEAINLMPADSVHTYVASQAALSASFYHQNISDFVPQLETFEYETPEVFGAYPNHEPVAPCLGQVPQKVVNRNILSYFNRNDYALTDADEIWPAWEFNNKTRPDDSIGYYYWGEIDPYLDPPPANEGFVTGHYEFNPVTLSDDFVCERELRFPGDRYEIFAYGAESRSKALGAVLAPPEFSTDSKDLADFGYNKERYSHSRQFRSNIVDEMGYWSAFVDDAKLTLINSVQGCQ
ncbi:MAG: alpha/beta hydrolase, partial [Desulfuromonadales bacterium]|nr:alpha/beta hydrolase [Desulfuromonadales bacterium]